MTGARGPYNLGGSATPTVFPPRPGAVQEHDCCPGARLAAA